MSSTYTPSDFKERPTDGKIRLTGFYMGIIKANNDSQRMGRLMVYIPELGGDETLQSNWYNVAYAAPFAGATPLSKNKENGKEMKDTQISYGFWMVPPDIDNQVLCTFVNGDPAQGYWFACIFQDRMNHMVPGVALNKSTRDDINQINLPVVCEYNKKDSEVAKDYDTPKRPIFEPLHNCMDAQGLYADPERGPATTSARREAPSQVFGFCSPRSNTIHIDDDPDNEFIRIRSRSGAQVLIHETTGYIYMISKEGNSWVEISDIGLDMYSKRSISLRAEENINIHADQSILTHGAGAVHVSGGTHTSNTSGQQHHKAAGKHKTDAQKGIKQNSKDDKDKKETKKDYDDKSAKDEQKKAENGQQDKPEGAKSEGGDKNVPGAAYAKPDAVKDAVSNGDYLTNGQSKNETQCATATKELANVPNATTQWDYVKNPDGSYMSLQQAQQAGYNTNGLAVATLGYGQNEYSVNGGRGGSGETHTGVVVGQATDTSWTMGNQWSSSGGFVTQQMNFDGSGWGSNKHNGAEAGDQYYVLRARK